MTHKSFKLPHRIIHPIYCGGLILALIWLLPSFYTSAQMAMNADIAFLSTSAQYMLEGKSMSEWYYDTNPPLSIIIYIPAIALKNLFGIEIYYAVFLYGFLLLCLSCFFISALLSKLSIISKEEKNLLLLSYLACNIIMVGDSFAQRDHILIMFLAPFMLAQFMKTYKIPVNAALKWCVYIFGAIAILIKPHYGIIPVALLCHRAYKQKRITIMLDKDFLALAASTLLYAAIIAIFFRDFAEIILPDVAKFYLIAPDLDILADAFIFLGLSLTIMITALAKFQKDCTFIVFLCITTMLCIIPFYLQARGFFYHAVPVKVLLFCAAGLLLYKFFQTLWPEEQPYPKISVLLTIAGMIHLAHTLNFQVDRPSHQQFKNSELVKELNTCPQKPCTFLMLNNSVSLTQETSLYSKQQHTSRFPTFWFIGALIMAHEIEKNPKENKTIQKYMTMINQDLEKHSPYTLIIMKQSVHPHKELSLIDLLSNLSPDFSQQMNQYTFEKTVQISLKETIGMTLNDQNMIEYDIYRRNNNDNN